jgi:hypothetical protein
MRSGLALVSIYRHVFVPTILKHFSGALFHLLNSESLSLLLLKEYLVLFLEGNTHGVLLGILGTFRVSKGIYLSLSGDQRALDLLSLFL